MFRRREAAIRTNASQWTEDSMQLCEYKFPAYA
jgi:hypothetical protein